MKNGIACVLAAGLMFGAVLSFGFRRAGAADADRTTWGASDPAWSPDGKMLAFSLFGSIWRVSPEGGTAEQLTTTDGYHAHPAWSPRGDRIAFVAGLNPQGRLPNISGELRILDLAAGTERKISTPHFLAGTIAWSPDGNSLAVGLGVPNIGSLLHEVSLRDGAVRQLQVRVQRHDISPWVDAVWRPGRPEIFFAAARGGAPQIWSLRSGSPPIQIQLPLTRHRPADIVLLHSISALPDGSGVIYSADVTNGRGNYELYRVAAGGGEPVAITHTERDEFSPAVSPDGRWIAHVSNHLGNIDMFLMPVAGGEKKPVRITALKFRQLSSWLRVRVLDERGEPTSVRLYVRASDGKAYCPAGEPIYYLPLDRGQRREGFFLTSGDDRFPLPAGKLQLVAVKGYEYDLAERTIEVAPGETSEITIQMRRWTNWMQRGWYTGENHFHANYNGSYYQRPPQSLRWLQAEDLNVANMMVANSEGAFVHDKEFFTGGVSPLSDGRYVLFWGQEYRNDYVLGHMAFANLRQQVPPSYTSVIGSGSPYDFPLNTQAALEARKQGGFVTYVHPQYAGYADVFDTWYGAKELPVTAAFGAVDSIDILPSGEAAYEMWYRLLNAGLRITAGAGTDCFTNYRGINRVPGSGRIYVEVGPTLTWDRWLARYREGRNFVTNGPLLAFAVNGQPPGSEIRVAPGQPYRARVTAEAVSRVPLRRIEIVQNGQVVEFREAGPNERTVRIDKEVVVEKSCWLAVRVTGDAARGSGSSDDATRAHTTPVWIQVGDVPTLVEDDVRFLIRWIDRLWALLEERNNFGPGDNREQARRLFDQARAFYEAKL